MRRPCSFPPASQVRIFIAVTALQTTTRIVAAITGGEMDINRALSAREGWWLTVISAMFGAAVFGIASGQFGSIGELLWSQEAAGWASALATFIAIVVALMTSQKALLAESAARDRDREEQSKKDTALAGRLAIVFDHEILILAQQLNEMSRELRHAINARNREELIEALTYEVSSDSLTLLAANTSSLHVFDGETAAKLMIVLSAWNSLAEPAHRNLLRYESDEYLVEAAHNGHSANISLFNLLHAARERIRPVALTIGAKLPDVPLHQV